MALDFPSSPTNGQTFNGYIYDTSLPGWRNVNTSEGIGLQYASGLVPIVPSSLSVGSGSASVNASGLITISGVNSVSINNVFSSSYRNYKVYINLSSTSGSSGGLNFRLRSAGTDRTGTNYYTSGSEGTAGGTLRSYNNNGNTYFDSCYLYSSSDSYLAGFFEVRDPEVSTVMTKVSTNLNNLSATGQGATTNTGVVYNTANSNDGFTFYSSAGTLMNGTLKIYGYR